VRQMARIYRFLLLTVFVLTTVACGAVAQVAPPTETSIPPSETPGFTATTAPSSTPISTDTIQPSDTPVPVTSTIDAALALQTQMMGTSFALMGSSAHLIGFLSFYSNPTGTPLQSWHDVPIMKEANAGQEFQADIYSYKAAATLKQATVFYTSQANSLNWSCFPPASGSSGTGNQANHQTIFLCGPLTILIASFDSDPNQVLVVINKAP
jgi:hypothetical protein